MFVQRESLASMINDGPFGSIPSPPPSQVHGVIGQVPSVLKVGGYVNAAY